MWILPKSLISAFAPGTEALTSDSAECSQTCAQSLIVRSKPSLARIFLRAWKQGNLTRLQFGLISNPSLGQSFLAAWTSSLEATHASHSAPLENALEPTIHGIFGPTSQAAFDFFSPDSVSLRTSRDTSASASEKSLESWKSWVIERRGEYLARLKLARLTSASACSSWPTTTTRDWKGCGNVVPRKDGKHRLDTLEAVVMFGPAALANPSTHGSRPGSWAIWGTPAANDANKTPHCEVNSKQAGLARSVGIEQAKAWATPRCSMAQDKQEDSGRHRLGEQIQHGTTGKLNPRWVETLMGLPVGWTMPSCASPVTIAPTSCASSATELFRQQPS